MRKQGIISLVFILVFSILILIIGCESDFSIALEEKTSNVDSSNTHSLDNPKLQEVVDDVALHHKKYIAEYNQFATDLEFIFSEYQKDITTAYLNACTKIDRLFAGYQESIPNFAKDITSLSSTCNIFLRKIVNVFSSNNSVENYVKDSFSKNVFDEKDLEREIDCIIKTMQAYMCNARTRFWTDVASYLNQQTTFSKIDIKILESEIKISGLSSLNNSLGNKIGDYEACVFTFGGVTLAVLTVTTALPGLVDDAIVMVGMIGASLIQNNERQKEIISCYSEELENIKNMILNDENKGLLAIYEKAIAEAEKEKNCLIDAIKEN
ncbi:hypothetical protein FYJ80_03855 [Spirochaetales bacterium NM-380-WT-3C1]|uniref:Lipoprotein n=1 Tax=Bullifex porci TaxID=2606638 RepID=A0A7X2TPY6_9SPIO|nr:hypothetical protein [Bullifex porci]MSU05914.1 hypothetical protein [Bullifex porci]